MWWEWGKIIGRVLFDLILNFKKDFYEKFDEDSSENWVNWDIKCLWG